MATSPYFNNYNAKYNEQRLFEDLVTESIKIMGFDTYYLPNDNDQARDLLYGEDPVKQFNTAFSLEMYLSSSLEHMGEKEFFSKFGLEIKNRVKVIVSRRSFNERVPTNTFSRPREGDLVYIPFLNGTGELYEITFVDQDKDFYTLGRRNPYYYEMELEKFKYSQEQISTGIAEIDQVVTDSAYSIILNTSTGIGTYNLKEIVFQSPDNTYENAVAYGTVQSWIPTSNALTITNIAGVFANNVLAIGSSSNARYTIVNSDDFEHPYLEPYDNKTIINQVSGIIDTSESNPIGGL
jgi:Virus neck protein